MEDLKNKNIIITGASGGIGNSIVEKLYETGANILASSKIVRSCMYFLPLSLIDTICLNLLFKKKT